MSPLDRLVYNDSWQFLSVSSDLSDHGRSWRWNVKLDGPKILSALTLPLFLISSWSIIKTFSSLYHHFCCFYRILDLGFEKDIAVILNALNAERDTRQNVLLSATLTEGTLETRGVSFSWKMHRQLQNSWLSLITLHYSPIWSPLHKWNIDFLLISLGLWHLSSITGICVSICTYVVLTYVSQIALVGFFVFLGVFMWIYYHTPQQLLRLNLAYFFIFCDLGVTRLADISLNDPISISIADEIQNGLKPASQTDRQASSSSNRMDQENFAVPEKLKQYVVMVPSKLRLVVLAAFILEKCKVRFCLHLYY